MKTLLLIAAACQSPTYEDVAPVLGRHCVECHQPGAVAPFSLTTYREARSRAENIAEIVDRGIMPPWSAHPGIGRFKNANSLTDTEKATLAAWAANPTEGNQHRQAFAVARPGWQFSREPDRVYYVGDEPFHVPADQLVDYQYYDIDLGFTEDKWISEAQVLPSNNRVVHHVGISRGDTAVSVATYVPGLVRHHYPPRSAMRIEAGTKLRVQMHYTPTGKPETDHTRLALNFADPSQLDREVTTIYTWDASWNTSGIPPGGQVDSHAEIEWPDDPDAELVYIQPHAHQRAISYQVWAEYPDGKLESLLYLPKWDFDWQFIYELKEPRRFPKGTKLLSTVRFDNSADNLDNPDPKTAVRWGEQTKDEMHMIVYAIAKPLRD